VVFVADDTAVESGDDETLPPVSQVFRWATCCRSFARDYLSGSTISCES